MNDLKSLSDDDLLRLMKAKNEEAFSLLYQRCQGGIYRFALQMSGSESIAEDVTQEVFVTLIHGGSGYDSSRGSIQSYLYGIARNLVLRALKRGRSFVSMMETSEEDESLSELLIAPDDPLDDLTRGEGLERLRLAILALPAHYREVVVLCDLEEMNYAEAAQALRCAVGTVRSRLHRAHALLVEKLRDSKTLGRISKAEASRGV